MQNGSLVADLQDRTKIQKSHLQRHELLFSRAAKLKYPASAGLNHQKSSKRGVRGDSSAISQFLGGLETDCGATGMSAKNEMQV